MKIGIVDLDTSHPQHWIPIARDLGHEIVGVWDGGAVHPPEYVARFASEHGIPTVFASLAAMLPHVDGVIIHGCDWDTHIAKARPFVEAGKAALIDKPLAGNLRDLKQLRHWAEQGARITGGSSLRFCAETRAWLALPIAQRGQPHTVICGCGVDDFNYGIHAYAMLSGIMGPGIQSVRCLDEGIQRRIWVRWDDRRHGLLIIGKTAAWLPFHATIVTERSCVQYQADTSRLYRALLEVALPWLAGTVAQPPLPAADWLEPELCALAARQSWRNGGKEVWLSELTESDEGYDGAAFADEYRRARYP